MKFFHFLNFILIVLLLTAICVVEDVVVSSSLQEIQTKCFEIENRLTILDDIQNMEMTLEIDNLEYMWQEDEKAMCFLVNHKNIQEIGQEIAKLKLYIASNDVDAFRVSLEEIKFFCHSYLHFMGANLHNVL